MILAAMMTLAMLALVTDARPRSPKASPPAKATIKITGFTYTPKTLTVKAGTTVEWVNESNGRHTVEADDGSFKSDTMAAGGKYEHTFDKPGKYPYHCMFHGEKGGKDMAGTVVVTK
jgi:plastocyanin